MNASFSSEVKSLVASIPSGRVMTYGQIAALAGNPQAARIVGGIAHYGDSDLPWHRVISKSGGLASGYPGGRLAHKKALEKEKIKVSNDYHVDVSALLWWPK